MYTHKIAKIWTAMLKIEDEISSINTWNSGMKNSQIPKANMIIVQEKVYSFNKLHQILLSESWVN